jgi:hypothetical protein
MDVQDDVAAAAYVVQDTLHRAFAGSADSARANCTSAVNVIRADPQARTNGALVHGVECAV